MLASALMRRPTLKIAVFKIRKQAGACRFMSIKEAIDGGKLSDIPIENIRSKMSLTCPWRFIRLSFYVFGIGI